MKKVERTHSQRAVIMAAVLAFLLNGALATPQEGRCSGTGSGTGESATLTCAGTCTNCPTPTTLPNGNMVCSCVEEQAPACCHVELENPGEPNSKFVPGGDCPSCNTVGARGVVTLNGITQPICFLPQG